MALVRTASPLHTRSSSPLPSHSGLRSVTPTRLPASPTPARLSPPGSLVGGGQASPLSIMASARSSSTSSSSTSSNRRTGQHAKTRLGSAVERDSCFSTLGLQSSASAPEIRQAYRALAKKHHPDAAGGDAGSAAKFLELRSAYEMCLLARENDSRASRRSQSAPRSSTLESQGSFSFGRSSGSKAPGASEDPSSGAGRTRRRASRRQDDDGWDLFDEMLGPSPRGSRRQR